jgi:addiction module HigA family antidote
MSKKNNYIIAPGQTIYELLEVNNITQTDLSSKLGLAPKTVNEIIKGKAAITTETALKLEYVFGLPASFWNNLESNYREKLLRQREYITSYESIGTIQGLDNILKNKDLDGKTMIEMTNRYLEVHDKLLDILDSKE